MIFFRYAIEYTDNPTRGCGWVFGGQAVDDFLMENDLLTIVRGILSPILDFVALYIYAIFDSTCHRISLYV